MKKVCNVLGVCIMFTALLIGTVSFIGCRKKYYGGSGGSGGNTCTDGYIPCGSTGKCCHPSYPYHGSSGYCYQTYSDCSGDYNSKCTKCG